MTGAEIAVVMAIGTAVSAMGALQQANAASDAARFNAARNQQNAAAERRAAAEQARREARLGSKRMGALRVLDPDNLDLLEESAIEEELNVQTILHGGEIAAMGLEQSAALDRARGKAARQAGRISAASTLLQGGAETALTAERLDQPAGGQPVATL